MPRYRLMLEYDGTRFSGWQTQPGERTVQGMLIGAARDAFGEVGEVMGSGRTDAGVHALAQSAHIDLRDRIASDALRIALNDHLPADVTVLAARLEPGRFHARHDAVSRSYLYQISRRRTAFGKRFVWWVRDPLDLGAMRRAALALRGFHDFQSFTDARPDEGSTEVEMESIEIAEADDLLLFRLRAGHFLRKMVRRVVGSLVEIGRGTMLVDAMSEALEEPRRGAMNTTAPPSGLFLESVIYRGERHPRDLRPAITIGHAFGVD